jgi:hypothetical protein
VKDPAKAMPPLAVTEPVKRNPISIIEKNPATCHVKALAKSLILLSIRSISTRGKVLIGLSGK